MTQSRDQQKQIVTKLREADVLPSFSSVGSTAAPNPQPTASGIPLAVRIRYAVPP